MELTAVIKAHPEYLGERHKGETTLPILVKLIDARKDLSVQVHPDDDYAKMKEHGQLGKTEMWYGLDAARDAKLIYGLRQDCTKKEMQKALAKGTVMKYLQKVPIHKDDLFFIPAGTIHAIGAGALVAEIQESSNLTYRLYDYDRIGKDGKKRELHIDKALAVARREPPKAPVGPTEPERAVAGGRIQPLFSCDKFTTETRTVEGEMADSVSPESFVSLLVLAGEGAIRHGGETYPVKKGQSVFLPAGLGDYALTGRMKLLRTRV